MKNLLSAVVVLICSLSGRAQTTQGRIVYERKIDIWRHLDDPASRNMVPQFSFARFELLFLGEESLFRQLPEDEDIRNKAEEDVSHPVMKMNFDGNDVTYRNYAAQKSIEQKELGPRKYLIDDSLRLRSWKLDGDTQTVAGHVCKKAETKDLQGSLVVAWYTEDLPAPAGPGLFGGLPGLILGLDINNGEVVFSTGEVSTSGINKGVIKAPAEGKRISGKDFQRMMDEQIGPGNGGMKIRIIHD